MPIEIQSMRPFSNLCCPLSAREGGQQEKQARKQQKRAGSKLLFKQFQLLLKLNSIKIITVRRVDSCKMHL